MSRVGRKIDAIEDAAGLLDSARAVLRRDGCHALALQVSALEQACQREIVFLATVAESEAVDALVDAAASQEGTPC